jgi:hypothetical protein
MDLHGAMEDEKQRRLGETTARYESLLEQWHALLDARQFEGSADLSRAVQSMAAEKAAVEATPTWPWQPGVFRRWIASLFLPLVIWLAQQWLGRTLGS